jgi:pSer/pThr/pTyr-binding forkhead associated (FHA) protein
MAKIILSMEGMVLKDVPLTKERITIGRKPHNDIQIDNLGISGEHAAITLSGRDVVLEDLNSTNGTHIEGRPVKKHLLKNGDIIELGKYRLKFIADIAQPGKAGDFEKTMVMRPDGSLRPGNSAADADTPPHLRTAAGLHASTTSPDEPAAAPAPSPAALQILSGSNSGKEMELTKTLTTLGKPGVQVAVIARRPHGYFITHVEGAHFPIVNGKALDAQAHPLQDHDIIEIGGIKMEFFFKG